MRAAERAWLITLCETGMSARRFLIADLSCLHYVAWAVILCAREPAVRTRHGRAWERGRSFSLRTTTRWWKPELHASRRACLRHSLGGVLDLLARGGLLHEEGACPLGPRAAHQGADRCRSDRLDTVRSLPGPRSQHTSMPRRSRARPFRAGVWGRDLGASAYRAQLGHADVAEGRPGAGDQRSVPPRPPPDLLGHPFRGCLHRPGGSLAVVDRRGSGRGLLRLQRDCRGAQHDQAVPRDLPGVSALDEDARTLRLLVRQQPFAL